MVYTCFLFDTSLQLSLAPDAIARVVAKHKSSWLARIEAVITQLTFQLLDGAPVRALIIEYKKLRTIVNLSSI
jgi:hypothetical protein